MTIDCSGSASVSVSGWVHAEICPVCGGCGFVNPNAGDYCPSCGGLGVVEYAKETRHAAQ